MIELVRINDAALAARLADTLRQQGIDTREQVAGGETVLSVEPARHAEARQRVEAFFRQAQSDAWQRSEPARDLPRQPLLSGGWFTSMGWVTRSVLIACVLIYLSLFVFGDGLYRALMFPDQMATLSRQPWRLFTPMLLHFSALHIIFNLLWWSDLGRIIERFQSGLQLAWITLVVAAVSNVAQFVDTGANFGGLSGVVYGLLGYLWLYGKTNPSAGYQIRKEIVVLMLVWLVVCYVGLAGIVANTAHLAGLVSGVVLGTVVGLWRRSRAGTA
ncbi:rhomboid family intramembrane serine protease [Alcanivorax sp. N3-2A]|nr:rhomboid family intramembrane serine protease [Alcanivorax sp. N3-2A]|tara:strand:- start:5627 stop:6445 length:819 start_codon:yes stop_codon:yes gene_type:complete